MYERDVEEKYRSRASSAILLCAIVFCLSRATLALLASEFRYALAIVVAFSVAVAAFLFLKRKSIKVISLVIPFVMYVFYLSVAFYIKSFDYFYDFYLFILIVGAVYFNIRNFVILVAITQISNLLLSIFVLPAYISGNAWVHFVLLLGESLVILTLVYIAVSRLNEVNNAFASFGALMRATPSVLILLDGDNKIKYISQSVSKVFGIKETEKLTGKNFLDLFNEKSVRDLFEELAKKRSFYEDYQKINVNSQIKTFNVFANKMTDNYVNGMFFMLNDVSEITKLKELAEQDSLMDGLIQIPNRRAFDRQILHEWNRALREKVNLSFLMIDIDYFKRYNDTYGHLQGDELLKVAGAIFKKNLKRSSDFVGRFGGEEFGVLLYGTNSYQAGVIAERIRKNVEEEVILTTTGEQTKFTVSIGVCSIIPSCNLEYGHIIDAADKALYKAKQNGRNRIWVSD
jgi:diguanylate cyclase (GGDEF)-like protein/PAS domain S-box-containing protein